MTQKTISKKAFFGECEKCGHTIRYFVGLDKNGRFRYMCAVCNSEDTIVIISRLEVDRIFGEGRSKNGDQIGV